MRTPAAIFITVTLIAIAACSSSFDLELSPKATMLDWSNDAYVVGPSAELSRAGHAAVQDWLSNNKTGWKEYFVTVPAAGVLIMSETFSLQVAPDFVLLYVNDKMYSKGIDESVGRAMLEKIVA